VPREMDALICGWMDGCSIQLQKKKKKKKKKKNKKKKKENNFF
jgi:hypothetical protein